MTEMQARANTNGAALEQTMLYLDDQSAQDYLDLCGSDAFVERFPVLPMAEIANIIIDRTGDRPLDLNALGLGDGRTEVALAVELVNRTIGKLRLHLLDISHPLLVIAYNRATEHARRPRPGSNPTRRLPPHLALSGVSPNGSASRTAAASTSCWAIRSRTSTMKWSSFGTSSA